MNVRVQEENGNDHPSRKSSSLWNECLERIQAGLSPLKHTPSDSGDVDKTPYYTD